ncbi:antibiotic biosynthesis monooxygenase [Corynebacterium glyciniphilum]|uniref:antibiotic biosynthesis monooxygenase n=1 Tax=Corynebacterium glyciniphilum TaxID=1404244 RepID=UPI002354B281
MTCITILTLRVPLGRGTDVLRYYASAQILEESGALSTRLGLKDTDTDTGVDISGGTDSVVVIAEWPDTAAYTAWQENPARESFSVGIRDAAGGTVTATSEVFELVAAT